MFPRTNLRVRKKSLKDAHTDGLTVEFDKKIMGPYSQTSRALRLFFKVTEKIKWVPMRDFPAQDAEVVYNYH